eukprot:9223728-Alexandrium_andersonii.AAC.1
MLRRGAVARSHQTLRAASARGPQPHARAHAKIEKTAMLFMSPVRLRRGPRSNAWAAAGAAAQSELPVEAVDSTSSPAQAAAAAMEAHRSARATKTESVPPRTH